LPPNIGNFYFKTLYKVSAMLTEFSLSNFKSYKNSRLPLAPLTVLIGANASGKSNIIEGLRFLSWLAEGQKLSSIQYAVNSADSDQVIRGRINDLCYREESSFSLGCCLDSTKWNQLDITINVLNGEMKITYEHITNSDNLSLYETDTNPSSARLIGAASLDAVVVRFYTLTKLEHGYFFECDNQKAMFVQLDIPQIYQTAKFVPQVAINPGENWQLIYNKFEEDKHIVKETVDEYQQALQNILFFDPVPSKMRGYSLKFDHQQLLENGSNLSSVLFHLWENQPENQKLILNFIQSLPEQAIDGLDFLLGPRDEVMVRLSETFGNTQRYCEAALLSDGTLRVLAIAAAMLSATEGSLVVIEEIDNGVHPSRAKHLLANIRDIAEKRKLRVLLSTHNPALMDALPDEALGDVVFCYRDPEQGDSRLVRLGDMDEFPGLIAQGSLGDLVTTGIVDRFVKHPQTPEDRKRKALEWLAHLQEYRNE
jgi:predicted ATPase